MCIVPMSMTAPRWRPKVFKKINIPPPPTSFSLSFSFFGKNSQIVSLRWLDWRKVGARPTGGRVSKALACLPAQVSHVDIGNLRCPDRRGLRGLALVVTFCDSVRAPCARHATHKLVHLSPASTSFPSSFPSLSTPPTPSSSHFPHTPRHLATYKNTNTHLQRMAIRPTEQTPYLYKIFSK